MNDNIANPFAKPLYVMLKPAGAHCNLACKYCFAGKGEYDGRREIMSYEVGKQALDYLIANSPGRRNLEVDF